MFPGLSDSEGPVRITLIAAVAENGVIGRDGGLPWHLPEDLKRFQRVTRGRTVVMGRRTFESLSGPLAGRRNLVVTSNRGYRAEGAEIVHSLEEAVQAARESGEDELYVLGGAELYKAALAIADRLDLTRVEASVEGDTRFPAVDWSSWRLSESISHGADDRHLFAYRFEIWERARPPL